MSRKSAKTGPRALRFGDLTFSPRFAYGEQAGPRDSVWLPEGTELTYLSESALLFFAIHPSNWQESQP